MKEKYQYFPNIIFRVPINPVKTSFNKEELKLLFSKKEFQEALFLSSPNLLNEYNKWKKGEITDKIEEEKLFFSLLKYALRMHNRCTPYGLFAGCGIVGEISETITIDTINIERSTRLDMYFTCALSQELAKLPFVQPHLKFYPNTSSYALNDKIRYVEYYYKENRRIHQISAVDNSVYIQKIIQEAKQGATIEQLANIIIEDDIGLEEALLFVLQIIEAQLLVSELDPAVTGEDLLMQILKTLTSINEKKSDKKLVNIISLLQDTQYQLHQIDKKIGNAITVYEKLAENLKQLNIPFELSKLFQTDLYFNLQNEAKDEDNSNYSKILKEVCNSQNDCLINIQGQLTTAIQILNQLTSKVTKTNLSEFQKKFHERFEDKEVSLLEVLDSETGIGYAQNTNSTGDVNPLINDLILPYNNNETELKWNTKQSFLFRKLLKAQQNNQKVIKINTNDVKEFKADWEDLPDSFSVMYKHLGKRDGKELLSINNVGGSSAINLLGRFASSNKKIEELVFEIATNEQQNKPDAILAEIVHLPENRTGNVLMRPVFRQYEIPYLSNSILSVEQQITLDDLYLSVRNNRLYLCSKRLKKEILPRLGNAHNYSFNSLPVYHFLCDLQLQNIRGGLFFDWGNLKAEFSFLPRVEIENVIVSLATWQLKKEQFQELLEKNESILNTTKKWQEHWQIPDLILLVDGDNELLINLHYEFSLKMFIAEIKKKSAITLKEFLFDKDTAIIRDLEGNAYANEFITLLQKQTKDDKNSIKSHSLRNESNGEVTISHREISSDKSKLIRNFSLGSEWLFYKLYCGVKTADKILTEIIKPLTEQLIEQKLIDSWFFIRYADPDIHLRIRFHFTALKNIGTVISLFQKAIAVYEKNGLIWKVQTDTYQREIERYGENTLLLGEQIFYYDSKCIVDVLDMMDGDEGEEIRWLFAIRAVNELLSDFNYSNEQKRDLMENLKIGFAHEFNMDKNLKMQMDRKFRIYREAIAKVLDVNNDEISDLQPLFELLKYKSESISPLVTEILTIQQKNQLHLPLNDLLASYIHMLLNRMFKNKHRMHEMVVYDFMWRTYRSALAQQKQLVN